MKKGMSKLSSVLKDLTEERESDSIQRNGSPVKE